MSTHPELRPRPDSVPKNYYNRTLRAKIQSTALSPKTVFSGHNVGVVASINQEAHITANGNTVAEIMRQRLDSLKSKHSNSDVIRRRAIPPQRLKNTNIYSS